MPHHCLKPALLALTIALAAAPAGASDYPARKPGLWELTTKDDLGGAPQVAQHCVDAASDQALQQLGKGMAQQMCADVKASREGDKYIIESTCAMSPKNKMHNRSVLSGNFQSAYREDTETRFDPPMMGIKSTRSRMEARWLGACKPGQKPGDVILDNGMKINLSALAKGAPKLAMPPLPNR